MSTRSCDDASIAAPDDVDGAIGSAALAAARRAGVSVRELEAPADLTTAAELAATVWKTNTTSQLDVTLLRALSHTGNFVVGAFEDCGPEREDRLVGLSVGFVTLHPVLGLHSHMTGTAPDRRDRGLGYALKLYQHTWAARAGLAAVTWTFDPLVRRNAYFNLAKLGAEAVEYVADFYGPMGDGLNSGDESDRLLMVWPVNPSAGPPPLAVPTEPGLPPGCDDVLEVGPGGAPRRSESSAELIACQVPADIVALREKDPRAALRWRHALREVIVDSMRRGYRIEAFTRSGHYVLRRRPTAAAGGG
ncbi:MAG TPA: GNAT family N-acetyltransferase [Nocardioidaceae bacterium]|nr:GNAT family N-acetyltransferase [Nocardioidaceae bacterium]